MMSGGGASGASVGRAKSGLGDCMNVRDLLQICSILTNQEDCVPFLPQHGGVT